MAAKTDGMGERVNRAARSTVSKSDAIKLMDLVSHVFLKRMVTNASTKATRKEK